MENSSEETSGINATVKTDMMNRKAFEDLGLNNLTIGKMSKLISLKKCDDIKQKENGSERVK